MIIFKLPSYNKTYKKLQKHKEELVRLEKILEHIRNSENFERLRYNPISIMYGFERLKYELSDYYSFNLCKSRQGMIRLIFKVDEENNEIKLAYISMKHYEDFKREI